MQDAMKQAREQRERVTPEQRARREEVDRRNRAIAASGAKPVEGSKNTFGHGATPKSAA